LAIQKKLNLIQQSFNIQLPDTVNWMKGHGECKSAPTIIYKGF